MAKTENKGIIFRDRAHLRKAVESLVRVSRIKRKRKRKHVMSEAEIDKTIEDLVLS